ncbi:hypothetical protein [Catenisphaera adipataccumulans]|jgi:hypothetical protein|uniref:Uncharacterized protein n=1 Tax=Catenisphaera adipataccumulans TaxID=700500 RepID=A0A7W8CYN9_9FIRM|nr:hypothetical protein [Catenisphaera adipataccumulans]MBB5182375.1 hypothetical protein [Catenisphaera adipataccumulans]
MCSWIIEEMKQCGLTADDPEDRRSFDQQAMIQNFTVLIVYRERTDHHILLREDQTLDQGDTCTDYAVNAADVLARSILERDPDRKIIAAAVTGDAVRHEITPMYFDRTGQYHDLDDLNDLSCLTEENIKDYYQYAIKKQKMIWN